MVRPPGFHCQGCRFNPWLGNYHPESHVVQPKEKKKCIFACYKPFSTVLLLLLFTAIFNQIEEKVTYKTHMYPYIFTYIVILTGILYFFVWIWITVKCPEGMLLIFLIGSDYRHWIFWVFVYLGMATFLVCSWRVVLLDVEFLVTGPFLSAQWMCHPSAFWPLWSDEKSAVIWMGNPCTRWVTLLLLLSTVYPWLWLSS